MVSFSYMGRCMTWESQRISFANSKVAAAAQCKSWLPVIGLQLKLFSAHYGVSDSQRQVSVKRSHESLSAFCSLTLLLFLLLLNGCTCMKRRENVGCEGKERRQGGERERERRDVRRLHKWTDQRFTRCWDAIYFPCQDTSLLQITKPGKGWRVTAGAVLNITGEAYVGNVGGGGRWRSKGKGAFCLHRNGWDAREEKCFQQVEETQQARPGRAGLGSWSF